MISVRTKIAQSRICPGNMKPMKYDIVRIIIQASKLQKVFIFLDIFLLNYIAPKCSSKMMYCMYHKELFYRANSNNSIKSKIKSDPAKSKYPYRRKTGRWRQFFCIRRDFCLRQFLSKTKKFLRHKKKLLLQSVLQACDLRRRA